MTLPYHKQKNAVGISPRKDKLVLPSDSQTELVRPAALKEKNGSPTEPLIRIAKEASEKKGTTQQMATQQTPTQQAPAQQTGGEQPSSFQSYDGTWQKGFYGQDEAGNVGYYADAERTIKLDNGNWEKSKEPPTVDPSLAGQVVTYGGDIYVYDDQGVLSHKKNASHGLNSEYLLGRHYDAIVDDPHRHDLSSNEYDLHYLPTSLLGRFSDLDKKVESGELTKKYVDDYKNRERARYGYSVDESGSMHSTNRGYMPTANLDDDPVLKKRGEEAQELGGGYTAPDPTPYPTPYPTQGTTQGATPAYPYPLRQPELGEADTARRRENDALAAELKALYEGESSPYARAIATYRAAQDAAAAQAVNRLEGQKSDVDERYAGLYRQLYRDSMNARQNLEQRLAAQGLTGGAAESTRLGYAASYADALRLGEQSRINELGEIDRAIADARLRGEQNSAQMAAELERSRVDGYANVLRALLSRGDTLAAQEWNRSYQLSRDAVNDAREWEQWAHRLEQDAYNRQLAAEQRSYNREQDALDRQSASDQLAYKRLQDEYNRARQMAQFAAQFGDYSALAGLGVNASVPDEPAEEGYTPTYTMAQLLSELDYLRKNPGAQPTPAFLADYEYYNGVPFAR
ncbi:MAG: hypothetical protein IJU66_06635 [Oscillospiraceae bacterium]|nr:hypothetical protein [Oscillospiraceae bacterium]